MIAMMIPLVSFPRITSNRRGTRNGAVGKLLVLFATLLIFGLRMQDARAQSDDCSDSVLAIETQANDELDQGDYAAANRDFRAAGEIRLQCLDQLPDDWSDPKVQVQTLMEASDFYGAGVANEQSGRATEATRLWGEARTLIDAVIEHSDDPSILRAARVLLAKLDSW